jgi:uncharacterized membrane protein
VRLGLARGIALASYLGLIALVMAWIVFLGDLADRYISIYLLVFVGPLLIPLRGVLATRDKPLVWGVLLTLPYAVHGGMEVWSGGDNRWLGAAELSLALSYLVSASYFIRWRAEAQKAA